MMMIDQHARETSETTCCDVVVKRMRSRTSIGDPQADRETLLQLSRDPACLVADTPSNPSSHTILPLSFAIFT